MVANCDHHDMTYLLSEYQQLWSKGQFLSGWAAVKNAF